MFPPNASIRFSLLSISLTLELLACGTRTDLADYGLHSDASVEASALPDAAIDSAADVHSDSKACSSSTCTGCCTASGECVVGVSADSCGTGGAKCADCTLLVGGTCNATTRVCDVSSQCGPSNCKGCCLSDGICSAGAYDGACGSGGAACQNCSQIDESCLGNLCQPTPTTCVPAVYPGCSDSLVSPTPAVSIGACSQDQIQTIGKMCPDSGDWSACMSGIQQLIATEPKCGKCLAQFAGDNAQAVCIAPFVDTACNHQVECAIDCLVSVCQGCADSQKTQCYTDAESGTCASAMNGIDCVGDFTTGGGGLCFDASGSGTDSWLQRIVRYYCNDGKL
jgi:hypothetical protein